MGNGLLLDGLTLYVVQNLLNRISVIDLAPDRASGTVVSHLRHSDRDTPTTIAEAWRGSTQTDEGGS
jgi:hypothetical protein